MYIRTSSFVSLEIPLQFIACIQQGFVDPKCNIDQSAPEARTVHLFSEKILRLPAITIYGFQRDSFYQKL